MNYEYDSKSNRVIRNGNTITKCYSRKLKEIPVKWPKTRKNVESSLLKMLQPLHNEKIRFPKILKETYTSITMTFIDAKPIHEIGIQSVLEKDLLRHLFLFLYDFYRQDYQRYINKRDLHKQRKIAYYMRLWKCKEYYPIQEECLCLGDLSIHNILVGKDYLALIDFECAHLGDIGYDIGQLLAMIQAAYPNDYKKVETVLFLTISDNEFIEKCLLWKERLFPFYKEATKSQQD